MLLTQRIGNITLWRYFCPCCCLWVMTASAATNYTSPWPCVFTEKISWIFFHEIRTTINSSSFRGRIICTKGIFVDEIATKTGQCKNCFLQETQANVKNAILFRISWICIHENYRVIMRLCVAYRLGASSCLISFFILISTQTRILSTTKRLHLGCLVQQSWLLDAKVAPLLCSLL